MKTLHWFGFIGQVLVGIAMMVLCFSFLFSWTLGWPGYSWGIVPWPLFGLALMGLMGLCMLAFCALFMGGRVRPMHSFGHWQDGSWMAPRGDSPFAILENRYSRGEITKEQFEELKRDLGL